ncbi:hypothetical protein Clacol_004071 [Clathrus columnatus]|uniref:S-formylglutathione hydrolase n=1 Tax=Clathrus columnatus TaxID=1419009 RepID=A0AAV5A861_9AGAM|nr:hypothetical protein Clacol_004071 [Clathrus columnatus]
MSILEKLSANNAFGGVLTKFKFESPALGHLTTQFNLFIPPGVSLENKAPVLFYLAGLECTEDHGPQKGGFLRDAASEGIALVFPDTSPRGAGVEGENDDWTWGTGAGFYVDATSQKWSKHYNMYTHVRVEIPSILEKQNLPLDFTRQSVFGHSMGGHGALTLYLKSLGSSQPFLSASAFAPVSNPTKCPWGETAFGKYLEGGIEEGKAHDATELIAKVQQKVNILIDYGDEDKFYHNKQLLPENFQETAAKAGHGPDEIIVNKHAGYNHSYYFISTFAEQHIKYEEQLTQKPKKIKFTDNDAPTVSKLATTEVDFPRGGGTHLTPLEYKNIRAEAIREADAETIFANSEGKKGKKRKHGKDDDDDTKRLKSKGSKKDLKDDIKKKDDNIRVEHLNYKRIVEGMKIFGKIIAVQPLALLVSLPCQLVGHIPITNVSSQLTKQLEQLDEEDEGALMAQDDEDEESFNSKRPLDLFEMFKVGQYVRTVVTAVRLPGATAGGIIGLRGRMDEVERASQRVELSLVPQHVNAGVSKDDLVPGFVLPAAVQSVEDHGYILDLGVTEITGFLSFKIAEKAELPKLRVGYSLDVCVSKVAENKRTCTVSVEPEKIKSSTLTALTSVTSVLPGTLVQALITAVLSSGLNVQVLGFLNGTIDISHIASQDFPEKFKLGQKIKARVLWDIASLEPRQFSLSLLPHIINLDNPRMNDGQLIQEGFPVGTILDSVKVVRTESEYGLNIQVQEDVPGYTYIRHVSDDHIPSLSPTTGLWKVGTVHRARVTGFHALDGVLQLSMQQSVLDRKFLQVQDVTVGEVLKATVKKLTPTALFVSLSGNIDAVIWPNHYADIMLKHPQKRFKEGATIKCRVLVVNPDKKRIILTAKRTLIESELPIISNFEDAKTGAIAHAVVYKVTPKGLMVEFYNNLTAYVSSKEASETPLANLEEAFPIGKPVKVRILQVNPEERRIAASIRQSDAPKAPDVQALQIGETVNGQVQAVHKEHIVITLKPSEITALLSLKNLANSRNTTEAQARTGIAVGEEIDDLIVVSQNPEKGIVIVSKRPKDKPPKDNLPGNEGMTAKAIQKGQLLSARVTDYKHGATVLHISADLKGILHPTDISDDYEKEDLIPSIGTVVQGVVLNVDRHKKQVILSTRPSQVSPVDHARPKDPEITSIDDLKVGLSIRGFIKNITDHGLYVTVGHKLDARVQIKELFDEYIKDWKPRFSISQLVSGKIAKINKEAKQIEMTLRSGPVELSLADFHQGQKVDGFVKARETYGLFIQLKDTKISGLCHKSEISDNDKADIQQVLQGFAVGDPVKAIILEIDLEKRRISFGLKPSYFSPSDIDMNEVGAPEDEDEDGEAIQLETVQGEEDDDSDDEVQQLDDGQRSMTNLQPKTLESSDVGPVLKTIGFQWSAPVQDMEDNETSSSDDSGEESDREQKKSKKKKKKVIEYDRTGDMHTRRPESTDDFERVLLGSPNSSFLWIQYMSFQLQLSEIEKAREVGKRALRTINFREEDEKLNVWIALLNLENQFGTDETLDAVFKDAARANDSKTIHLRLATIFDESGRHERVVEQYQKTCKKFGQSSKVWTLFAEYYFKHQNFDAARQLLPRSLQSLEKRKHIKTISRFAILEYKLGEPERGKTIFEGIVDSHPKRWDLWSVYIDMEALQNNIQSIRNLLDRVLSLKMTSFKAKAFFKKWLELEKRIGDVDGESNVKAKAIEWTQKAGAGAL